ncbi:MAG: hypothetical protein ACI395_04280, partial [Candidatus Cryptobacteroides sp.]
MSRLILSLLSAFFLWNAAAFSKPLSTNWNDVPLIGGQVFIEPGQTEEMIEGWFRLLSENKMKLCRIRMFENYMKDENGNWDFSLFDTAFRMADKYGVKIYATLFPDTPFTDIGGFKYPHSDRHLEQIDEYVAAAVGHFSAYESLYAWVLMNEPGSSNVPFTEPFTSRMYSEWKSAHPYSGYDEDGYRILDFRPDRFTVDYQTWYLKHLAET